MHLSIVLLAQAASPPAPTTLDLRIPAHACATNQADEVVVCGWRSERSPYRLPELSTEYQSKSRRAETQLAPGVKGRLAIESVELPGGAKSDRLMVHVTIGF